MLTPGFIFGDVSDPWSAGPTHKKRDFLKKKLVYLIFPNKIEKNSLTNKLRLV